MSGGVSRGMWQPGVLADWQIQYLAEHEGMIEPFESKPVRFRHHPCTCKCAPDEHGPYGCTVWYGDKNTGFACDCRWQGPDYKKKVISYGLGHYGYDMRVAREFKVFTPTWLKPGEAIVDPKKLDEGCMSDFVGDVCRIPPNSFALARSVERFKIPRDVLAIVISKSTYARVGVIVNCTPLEPEWFGYVTLEISNTTPLPAMVYAGEGLAQVVFHKASSPCRISYAEKGLDGRGGKYQGQGPEIVLPRL